MTGRVFTGRASPVLRGIVWASCGLGAAVGGVAALQATGKDRTASLVVIPVLLLTALGVELFFGSVSLHVLPSEVRVDYGRTPLKTRVRIDQIASVDVTDIRAWKWGYGYRGSRKLFRKAGIVVRSGEALRLHLTDGTTLAVTVDDADEAAIAVRGALGGS